MSRIDDVWSSAVSAVRLGRGSRVRVRARTPEKMLELWEFEACPYCRKVREVMSELDLTYVCHPVARGSGNRDATPSYGGRKSYPYLVDPNTETSMKESEDIIDYLHRTYVRASGARNRTFAPINTFGSFLASGMRPRGRVARPEAARRKQPEELLVLYQFEGCPFCRKVREKLHELNLDHAVINCAKGSARRAALERLGGKVQLPYLLDPNTGVSLYESDAINAYLEERYGRAP